LAFAGQIRHRCLINKEAAKWVAADLGLDVAQTEGAVRLLKKLPRPPSRERLALVAMRDPGLDDADIAEMFAMPIAWAADVRDRCEELRVAEPISEYLEYLEEGLRPGDPTPAEILVQAERLRLDRPPEMRMPLLRPRRVPVADSQSFMEGQCVRSSRLSVAARTPSGGGWATVAAKGWRSPTGRS
jgi:hypothetical protein